MKNNSSISFLITTVDEASPIEGAIIYLYDSNNNLLETVTTDISGKTVQIEICAPNVPTFEEFYIEYVPYATYNAKIEADGYVPVIIKGMQAYAGVNSVEPVEMNPYTKNELIREDRKSVV